MCERQPTLTLSTTQTTASDGGFNRSMQHTNRRVSSRSVADEAANPYLLL
jgi:hypothetical protein